MNQSRANTGSTLFDRDLEDLVDDFKEAMTSAMSALLSNNTQWLVNAVDEAKKIYQQIAIKRVEHYSSYSEVLFAHVDALKPELDHLDGTAQLAARAQRVLPTVVQRRRVTSSRSLEEKQKINANLHTMRRAFTEMVNRQSGAPGTSARPYNTM